MDIRYTTEISAPADRVWRYITEPELQKQWMRGVVANVPIEGEPNTVGSKSRMTIREGGSNQDYEVTLTEFEPHERLTVEMRGKNLGDTPMQVEYRLTDLVTETRLDYRCLWNPSSRVVRFVSWIFGGFAKGMLVGFMKSLKELCEAEGAA
ncbi:MAG: SRPBCC family protein [Isosphaeraceae bacterium]|nr:SRPBCC family protein [Isosphaeraceae bacterium]